MKAISIQQIFYFNTNLYVGFYNFDNPTFFAFVFFSMKLHIYIPAIVFVAVCWFALSSTPFLQGIFRLPRLPVWGMFLSSVLSDTWGQGSSGLQSVDQLPRFPLVRLSYSEHPSAEDLLTSPQDFHDLTAPVIVISTGQAPGR